MDLGRTKEQVANKSMNLQDEKEITNYEQKAEKIRGKTAVKNKIRKPTASHPDSAILHLNHNGGRFQMSYPHSMSMI